MEKNEQELRKYLRKRIDDYCRGKLCNECDVRETCYSGCPLSSELPTSKLQEIYCAMYPEMKSTEQINVKEEADRLAQMKEHFGKIYVPYDDQQAKADYGKEQLTLVPRRIIHDICAIRMYGNQKYPDGGPDNWKKVAKERYRDAAYRHFLAYLDDPQGKDKESDFPHLWHLACNIAFLCEFEDEYAKAKEEDDGLHCKHCLYSDEDEDGEHCSECKYAHTDNFVRKTK